MSLSLQGRFMVNPFFSSDTTRTLANIITILTVSVCLAISTLFLERKIKGAISDVPVLGTLLWKHFRLFLIPKRQLWHRITASHLYIAMTA